MPWTDQIDRGLMKCLTFLGFTSELALLYGTAHKALYPILLMPIVLYCYEQLVKRSSQVDEMMVKMEGVQRLDSS
ncbi:MAG TPA: hypothetical protein VFZ67_07540 [Nitrososphaera sp.]